MIPFVVPPLSGLTVLVTRPAAQAALLCARIETLGGTGIAFPAIEIEPVVAHVDGVYDLIRDTTVDLGLGLVRLQQGRHRIEEVFRDNGGGDDVGPA